MKKEETVVRLTLSKENEFITKENTSELVTDQALELPEFMELVEELVTDIKTFSKEDLEEYVLKWARDIEAEREKEVYL